MLGMPMWPHTAEMATMLPWFISSIGGRKARIMYRWPELKNALAYFSHSQNSCLVIYSKAHHLSPPVQLAHALYEKSYWHPGALGAPILMDLATTSPYWHWSPLTFNVHGFQCPLSKNAGYKAASSIRESFASPPPINLADFPLSPRKFPC
jgi:hypothetical protein